MSPAVQRLFEFIEQQNALIRQLAEQIQQLQDEIARLKNQPPKPKIKPSSLGKEKSKSFPSTNKKRPGFKKRFKTAQINIHQTKPIEPEIIPLCSVFRYYKDFVVQDSDEHEFDNFFICERTVNPRVRVGRVLNNHKQCQEL